MNEAIVGGEVVLEGDVEEEEGAEDLHLMVIIVDKEDLSEGSVEVDREDFLEAPVEVREGDGGPLDTSGRMMSGSGGNLTLYY